MIDAIGTVARLTWMRLRRSKLVWVTVSLALFPVLMAALLATKTWNDPVRNWQRIVELALRFVATLAATIHLANAVGEEIEGKTYTYLWSRPFPRPALLFGKIAAVTPLLFLVTAASLGVCYVLVFGGEIGAHLGLFARALLASGAAIIAASAFSVGIGALFPKHPFIFTLAYFAAEQLMFLIPNVANLSILTHARVLADLRQVGPADETFGFAVGALVILTTIWLAVGVWRVSASEYARADL